MGLKSIKKRHARRTHSKGNLRAVKKKPLIKKMSNEFAAIRERWNPRATIKENYKALGLRLDPNQKISKTAPENPIEFNVPEPAPPREARLSHQEIDCIQRLLAKHGNNYKAMERDIKINVYQNTKKQLQKKIQIYQAKYLNPTPKKPKVQMEEVTEKTNGNEKEVEDEEINLSEESDEDIGEDEDEEEVEVEDEDEDDDEGDEDEDDEEDEDEDDED